MRKLKIGLVLLAAVLCLTVQIPASVNAATTSELDQQTMTIQAKQDALNQQLNQQMATVSQQTIKTNKLKQTILDTQKIIDHTQQNILETQKDLKQRKAYAAKRLSKLQHANDQQSIFNVMISSKSLADMIRNVYVVRAIQKADVAAISDVDQTYQQLKTAKTKLVAKQSNLLSQQQTLDTENSKLQTDLQNLKQTLANNQNQLQQLNQEKAQLQQQQAAAKQLAAEQAAAKEKAAAAESAKTSAASTPAAEAAPTQSATQILPTPELSGTNDKVATGVKISFYDPAVLGSSMGYGGVAANLAVYPKGTRLKIVFADGTEIHRVVNDTGTFVYSSPNQIDVAWPNAAIPSYGITTATVTVE